MNKLLTLTINNSAFRILTLKKVSLMQTMTFAVFLTLCCISTTFSQSITADETPKVEVFVGYSASGEINSSEVTNINNQNPASFFSNRADGPKGFEVSVTGNVNRYVGIKGDFSAHFKNTNGRGTFTGCTGNTCPLGIQDFNIRSRAFQLLAGPEFKARNSTRLTPFVHGLFGVGIANAKFETNGTNVNFSSTDTRTGFAMAFGGGVDVRATRRFSIRSSVDYNPTFLGSPVNSSSNRQDNVRFSLGVLFR